jgi:hypothetical protein
MANRSLILPRWFLDLEFLIKLNLWSPPVAAAVENSIYFLIVYGGEDNALFVFLGDDPSIEEDNELEAIPVTLELLPPPHRFGGVGGVAMGMPLIGRWPGSMHRFRQFLTFSELEQAGWVSVERYRICDCWNDFHSPWSFLHEEQPTPNGLLHRDAPDDTDRSGTSQSQDS